MTIVQQKLAGICLSSNFESPIKAQNSKPIQLNIKAIKGNARNSIKISYRILCAITGYF